MKQAHRTIQQIQTFCNYLSCVTYTEYYYLITGVCNKRETFTTQVIARTKKISQAKNKKKLTVNFKATFISKLVLFSIPLVTPHSNYETQN